MDSKEYDDWQAAELRQEQAAWVEVRRCLQQAAEAVSRCPDLWICGEGEGGSLTDAWKAALADRGFQQTQSTRRSPKRKPTAAKISLAVFRRDGFRCRHCGTSDNLTVDHVVPSARNGPHEIDNMQTLCGPCNSRKGTRDDQPAEVMP